MNANAIATTRDAKTGRFVQGNPGGAAGRRCGRSKAIAALDEMLSEGANLEALRNAMQDYFQKSPVRFFRQIIMPLLPISARMEIQHSGPIVWRGIVETMDERDAATSRQHQE